MAEDRNQLAAASFASQRARTHGLRRMLSHKVPKPIKRRLNFVIQSSLDSVDALLGRRRDLVPPRRLNFVGDGDFEKTGDEFLRYFVELAGLQPNERVLEIGCGIGRMARPLTRYLRNGSYEGMDIVEKGISWCRRNVTPRYPRFKFHFSDVRNDQYNPKGTIDASQYRFPFQDGEFDFVFLTSVFTHMVSPTMLNYLREISRVLRSGGRYLITFFLLNDGSQALIRAGRSSLSFPFRRDGCWVFDESAPEDSVAYEEEVILEVLRSRGLTVSQIHYGGWCGRREFVSYQDIVVGTRC